MNNKELIRQTLLSLLQEKGTDAFVIVEEPVSGKFVQFVGSSTEPLLLDLPTQTLTGEEQARATRLFGAYGARCDTHGVLDRPNGVVVGEQSGFNLDLGRDVDKTTEVALRVFSEVYLFPAASPLRIIGEH